MKMKYSAPLFSSLSYILVFKHAYFQLNVSKVIYYCDSIFTSRFRTEIQLVFFLVYRRITVAAL